MNYLVKTDKDGYRLVYRIEAESQSHYTVTIPLFVCWGSVFHSWGRKKNITKKWVDARGWERMDRKLAKKYDNIKKDDGCEVLY